MKPNHSQNKDTGIQGVQGHEQRSSRELHTEPHHSNVQFLLDFTK